MTKWGASLLLTVTVVAGSAGRAAEPPEGELINAVVAIVDNETITSLEVEQLVAQFQRSKPDATASELRAAWHKARELLIDQALIKQEAQRRQIQIEPEDVNKELERLKELGMDVEGRRDEVRERLMVSRFLAMLSTVRSVTPKEVEEYYRKHAEEFLLGERRHVFLISIESAEMPAKDGMPATRTDAKALAKQILERLKKGEDFAALAKKHSHGPFADKGGDLGWFKRGILRSKKREDAVFSLKPGQVSDIIDTPDGYDILKVAGVQPATRQSLAQAREAIVERLLMEKRREQERKLIGRLRQNASIIRLDIGPKTP